MVSILNRDDTSLIRNMIWGFRVLASTISQPYQRAMMDCLGTDVWHIVGTAWVRLSQGTLFGVCRFFFSRLFSSQEKSRFASDFLRRGNRASWGPKTSRDFSGSGKNRRRSRRESRDFGALRAKTKSSWIRPFLWILVFFLGKISAIHIELLFQNAPGKSSWTGLSLVWFARVTPDFRATQEVGSLPEIVGICDSFEDAQRGWA